MTTIHSLLHFVRLIALSLFAIVGAVGSFGLSHYIAAGVCTALSLFFGRESYIELQFLSTGDEQ